MAQDDKPQGKPNPPPNQSAADKANAATGGQTGTKAPALGTDARPVQAPAQQAVTPDSSPETALPGQLGKGGPQHAHIPNMGAETVQSPTQNATAGGPDAGQTPVNEPGMSHGLVAGAPLTPEGERARTAEQDRAREQDQNAERK